MVEYVSELDNIFASLADPTRRDILAQVARGEFSVGELVARYDLSFAAISKHLKVLQQANLITKRRDGRKQIIALAPWGLKAADRYLELYRDRWQDRPAELE